MQHMVLSLPTRVRGGLSVHSLSENSGVAACAVNFENLAGPQLVKKFAAICGSPRFTTAFSRARHLSLY
jgi:hypothetical protein